MTDEKIQRVVEAARRLVRSWDEFGTDCREAVGEELAPLIDAIDALGDPSPYRALWEVADFYGNGKAWDGGKIARDTMDELNGRMTTPTV